MPPDPQSIPALGVDPCTKNPPAGVSLQDELDFDQLQNDVQALVVGLTATPEMEAVGAKDPPTWERISDQAFEMLRDRSKDLRIASYLTIAMMHVRGYEGLKAGLEMVHGLMTNFWDNLFPPLKMMRGRGNALDFIASKVAGESDTPGGRIELHQKSLIKEWDELVATNPSMAEKKALLEEIEHQTVALRGCLETLGKWKDLIYEKFPPDKLPAVTSLREASETALPTLEDFVKRNKPKEAPAGGEEAGGGAARPAAGQARPAAGAGGAAVAAGPMESAADVFKWLGRCAAVLRQTDPTSAASYRMNRWAIWNEWTVEPPNDGRLTKIPDPQKTEVDQARMMFNSGNWMALLNNSEERFGSTPIWLDRQYYIYMALGGMGPAFKAAQEAVRDELRLFLKRLPALPKLAYAGGLAFADPATQAWIEQVVMVEGGGGGGGAAIAQAAGGGQDDALKEAMSEARKLINDGKLPEAIRILQAGPPSPSGRSRFLWRMALAQLVNDNGKARQAAPIWEELMGVIDQNHLETWEPDLCMPVYRALYRVLKSDKTQAEAAESVFRRMCRLDPAAALDA